MREMIDSEIDYIGIIPRNWSIMKNLYCLEMPITDGPHTTPELYSNGIPFVSAEAVSMGNGSIDFNHIRGYISKEFYDECCKKYIPRRDDILMIKSGATTGKVSIIDTDRIFTIWSPLAVMRYKRSIVIPKYLFYYLQSPIFQRQIELNWTYGTQQNIGMRTLEQLKVIIPPLDEQERILNAVDKKRVYIDELIENLKTQIFKLKQYKQSVISEAVTRGLEPSVPMKDCEIEWIGKIPTSWEVHPSKTLFQDCKGRRHQDDEQLTASQKYGMISQAEYMELENQRVVLADKGLENWKHVEPGDFIISLRSFQGGLELTEIAGCVTWHYIVLRAKRKVDTSYFKWLFKSKSYITALQRTCNYIRDGQDLRYSNFIQVPLCVPPISEQKEIGKYLNLKTAQIDSLISIKQSKIAKLTEYRKALIYEYVTGKKEVV